MTNPCIAIITDKEIVFSDKKSKSEFKILNEQQRKIEKHKVDDCLIKGNDFLKCDWLAIDKVSRKEVYIELKGKNVEHAIKQICSAIEKLSENKNAKKLGYVICTRSPLSSTQIQTLAKQVRNSHQLILRVKSKQHTEKIEKVIADLDEQL